MFTGIIESVGKLTQLTPQNDGYRVEISTGKLDLSDVKLGDSIASNGVCLTVVSLNSDNFCAINRICCLQYRASNQFGKSGNTNNSLRWPYGEWACGWYRHHFTR